MCGAGCVHKASITACVRIAGGKAGEPHQEIGEFSATTRGLLQLRDWLASFEVTWVGMEATGAYWKPVSTTCSKMTSSYGYLTPATSRTCPARKTDVKDAEWICRLVEHGLVPPSFVPPKER